MAEDRVIYPYIHFVGEGEIKEIENSRDSILDDYIPMFSIDLSTGDINLPVISLPQEMETV